MQFDLDEEANARIERHKAHLPEGKDLTLLVLKGHLLVEEGLEELISVSCPEPEHILKSTAGFAMKARIAQSLTGHLIYRGLWPMIEALNTLRNDLAHKLDSPKLNERILNFMDQRRTHMQVLSDPLSVPKDQEVDVGQLRTDISILIGQLTGNALIIRALVRKLAPWKAMVEEVNRK